MNFNVHSELAKDDHAYLSASKYHWINYSEEKMATVYRNHLATLLGTELHDYAALAIKRRLKQPRTKTTLHMYINDAIGYRMTPEQKLVYSPLCFGTADAISFDGRLLRIHDLKTGQTPAHMHQLEIYAALFCLEYKIKPADIDIELRIYQCDEIIIHEPTVEDIVPIMDKIVSFDKLLTRILIEEM